MTAHDRTALAAHLEAIRRALVGISAGSWDRLDAHDAHRLDELATRLGLLAKGLRTG